MVPWWVDFFELNKLRKGEVLEHQPQVLEKFLEIKTNHFQCLEKFGDLQTSEILDF